MEDFEAQELEFWARLSEEGMSRSTDAPPQRCGGFGLTVLARARVGTGVSRPVRRFEPCRRAERGLDEGARQRSEEGRAHQHDRPAARLGELRRDHQHVQEEVRAEHDRPNPDGTSAEENQAITSLKGSSRAPDAVDVGPSFAIQGAAQGLYAPYRVSEWASIPASLRDPKGRWTGDYWGAISIGYNSKIVNPAPTSFKDLLNPAYKGQVALNGSPLTSNSAVSGVFAAALANGGSLSNVTPGVDFFGKLKSSGNFITVESTPQTVASGQTPISIDWDYLNLGYVKEFPAASWKVIVPSDGVYGSYYAQAINAQAPNPWAARLWEEFLYSDQGQLLWLKGFSHPIRFQDLSKRKVIPASMLAALPSASLYSKVQFASDAQQVKAKAVIAKQWPAQVGS